MKIEFYLVDAFEVANYEPIWQVLRKLGIDARMVAVPGISNRAANGWFDFDRAAAYFRKRQIPFLTEADFSAVGVTTQSGHMVEPYAHPHLRLMYGPNVYPESWGLSAEAAQPFDGILVHGAFYQRHLAQWKNPEQLPVIGYPRYDELFAGRLKNTELRRDWQLEPSKPVLLYLPTWGENSSFDLFFGTIASLQSEFQVVVKPHHCTLRMEPKRVEAMRASGVRTATDAFDLPGWLAVADVVLADARSCALTEALVAGKKVIGLVQSPAEMPQWIEPSGLTRLLPFLIQPDELRAQIHRLLEKDALVSERAAWVEDHVAFRDGTASERAAQAILRLIEEERKNPLHAIKREARSRTRSVLNAVRHNRWVQRVRHPLRTWRKDMRRLARSSSQILPEVVKARLRPFPINHSGVEENKHSAELVFWQKWVTEHGTGAETEYYKKFMLDMGNVESAAFFDGMICLDIGCGPRGSMTWLTNARYAIGLDPLAEQYCQFGIHDHGMLYLRGRSEELPFATGYVDVVFSMNSLDHVDDFVATCREIRRVLRPGGYFIGSINLEEPATVCEPWTLTEALLETHLFSGWERQFYRVGPKLSVNEHFGPYRYFYEDCPPELLEKKGPKALWCRFRVPEPTPVRRSADRSILSISGPIMEDSQRSPGLANLVSHHHTAMQWIESNSVPGAGIRVFADIPSAYPEVTGYYIPTLLNWGEHERAVQYARWLVSIQNADGSWSDFEGLSPYTFDTGQILKGLLALLPRLPELEPAIRKGCDWMLTQIQPDGRVLTPDKSQWGLPGGGLVSENIHLYALEPLRAAGKYFRDSRYTEKVEKALAYYLAQPDLHHFNTLSHFHAYVMEALIDLGHPEVASKGMAEVERLLGTDGSIPAYPDVKWVCSTGLAQYAVVWYKLGRREQALKAFECVCQLQNPSGGFYGSYGRGANYFPDREISWAVKYFLDACFWHIRTAFDSQVDAGTIHDAVDESDGRLQAIFQGLGDVAGCRVLDAGCGKGHFSRIIREKFPSAEIWGVDISDAMLLHVPPGIKTSQGSLLNLAFDDGFFDRVFSVEALEHCVNPQAAIRELCRVIKSGGRIVIVDKNVRRQGALEIEPWETWVDRDEITRCLNRYCTDVRSAFVSHDDQSESDDLFVAWYGVSK